MGYIEWEREDSVHDNITIGFGTIVDIAAFMAKHGIPGNATIQYAGCGSHNIAFSWPEPDFGQTLGIHNTIKEGGLLDR